MKFSRKLLPAIAMLLISAVMMSTASFAWFSTNTTAEASGMSVTVASARNILISSDNSTFASSATFNSTAAALKPASAVPANTPAFYYMSTSGTGMTAEDAAYGEGATFAEGTANTHYITFTAYLKVVGEDVNGATIVPTINFAKTDSPVYSALRVLFVVDGNANFLYAPVGTPDAACKPISAIGENGAPTVAEQATATYKQSGTDAIVPSVTKEQVYTVQVYVWLEGQDASCTAANAVSLAANALTIDFTIPANAGT